MSSNKGLTFEGEIVEIKKDQFVNKMDNSIDILLHSAADMKPDSPPKDPEYDGEVSVNHKKADEKKDKQEDKKEDKKEDEKEDEKEEKTKWGGWTKSMENLFLWWN